jgi:hypothetical protein
MSTQQKVRTAVITSTGDRADFVPGTKVRVVTGTVSTGFVGALFGMGDTLLATVREDVALLPIQSWDDDESVLAQVDDVYSSEESVRTQWVSPDALQFLDEEG